MAVVYTTAMPNTVNNAIWIAWWDVHEKTWGTPNILAMRHLQVYEDGITHDMTPEELEQAYLGNYLIDGVKKGSESKLYFSDIQMSTCQVTGENNEVNNKLLILTMGSFVELE